MTLKDYNICLFLGMGLNYPSASLACVLFVYIHRITTLLQNHYIASTFIMKPDCYLLYNKEN